MKKKFLKQLLPGLLALLFLCCAATCSFLLRARRHAQTQLRPTVLLQTASDETSPLIEFSAVALGGFRGILADLLWLRAGRMQEQRRFVELVQLSDWVTQLEPHNEDVWAFHAWNLSYNVSFLLPRPEDRWHWVFKGIELLRDRALALNPCSARLKQELGWIFQHKLGMDTDTAAAVYRDIWARKISPALQVQGAAPDPGSEKGKLLRESFRMDAAYMRKLEKQLGSPLDWRLPLASSFYWAMLALEEGGTETDPKMDLACRRMVYTSLSEMIRGEGDFLSHPADPAAPQKEPLNLRLIPYTAAFFRETLGKHPQVSGTRAAYVGFLLSSVMYCGNAGDFESAARLYAHLGAFLSAFEPGFKMPPLSELSSLPEGYWEEIFQKPFLL